MSLDLLGSFIAKMACPKCFKTGCHLSEVRRRGLSSTISVTCTCGYIASCETTPSVREGKKKTSEANLLVSAASRNCGIGYQKMCKFLGGLNIPQPMHLKTYQAIAQQVHRAAVGAAEKSMQVAAQAVWDMYSRQNPTLQVQADDMVQVVVSYDGTWHKRGHSSHHGLGVVIELSTGLVLDYKVLSNYCHGCAIGPEVSSPKYAAWKEKHVHKCQRNYKGSANSMEVAAAKRIFTSSREKYHLEYTTVLCDGDAKTIQSLNDVDPYSCPIEKEDCVNHVAKRLWKAIENKKKAAKGTAFPLSGRGKLTREVQDRLAAYYAKALKDNAPDVKAMKQGVYAALFHMVSTDEKPHHKHCPTGPTSWCFFNRAIAKDEAPRAHKPTLRLDVAEQLLPILERLTDESLLQRCSRMKTQNANECFNAQVWRRCPKTEPTSLVTVETAAAMAVLEFNAGPQGFHDVLKELDLSIGVHQLQQTHKATKLRLRRAAASSAPAAILKRRRGKRSKAKQQDVQEAVEGVTYSAGDFNL